MDNISLDELIAELDTAVELYDKRLQYQQVQLLQSYEKAYNAKVYDEACLELEQLQ